MEIRRRSLRFFVAVVMFFGVASSPLMGVRPVQAQAVNADDQFFARFVTFLADMEVVVASNPNIYPAGFAAAVAESRQRVSGLSSDERGALLKAYAGNESFLGFWRTAYAPLAQINARRAGIGLSASKSAASNGGVAVGVSNAFVSSSCPPDVDLETLLGLRAAVTVLNAAVNAAGGDVTGVVIGIAAAAALAGQIALDVLEFDQARADACADADHENMLRYVADKTDELASKMGDLASQTSVNTVQSTLSAHSTAITNLLNAWGNQLDALIKLRADLLTTLVNKRADYIDATLANVTAKMAVTPFEIIELKKNERFLLVTNEGGVPVNVDLVSVRVSDLKPGGSTAFDDVTTSATSSPTSLGLLEVKVTLPTKLKDAKLFEFKVKHPHGIVPPLGNVDHFGIAIFVVK